MMAVEALAAIVVEAKNVVQPLSACRVFPNVMALNVAMTAVGMFVAIVTLQRPALISGSVSPPDANLIVLASNVVMMAVAGPVVSAQQVRCVPTGNVWVEPIPKRIQHRVWTQTLAPAIPGRTPAHRAWWNNMVCAWSLSPAPTAPPVQALPVARLAIRGAPPVSGSWPFSWRCSVAVASGEPERHDKTAISLLVAGRIGVYERLPKLKGR